MIYAILLIVLAVLLFGSTAVVTALRNTVVYLLGFLAFAVGTTWLVSSLGVSVESFFLALVLVITVLFLGIRVFYPEILNQDTDAESLAKWKAKDSIERRRREAAARSKKHFEDLEKSTSSKEK